MQRGNRHAAQPGCEIPGDEGGDGDNGQAPQERVPARMPEGPNHTPDHPDGEKERDIFVPPDTRPCRCFRTLQNPCTSNTQPAAARPRWGEHSVKRHYRISRPNSRYLASIPT